MIPRTQNHSRYCNYIHFRYLYLHRTVGVGSRARFRNTLEKINCLSSRISNWKLIYSTLCIAQSTPSNYFTILYFFCSLNIEVIDHHQITSFCLKSPLLGNTILLPRLSLREYFVVRKLPIRFLPDKLLQVETLILDSAIQISYLSRYRSNLFEDCCTLSVLIIQISASVRST